MKKNEATVTQKQLEGTVISTKMKDTVVVDVEIRKAHPFYKKIMTTNKRYQAHTKEQLQVGDVVTIEQIPPISKNKKWAVIEVKK